MKKLALVFAFALATLVGFSSFVQAAERLPAPEFLKKHYGWTFLPQETHWYSSTWEITCPEKGRMLLPRQKGSYVPFNWVCSDTGTRPINIVWRISKPEELEEDVYKRYTEGYGYTKSCSTQVLPSAVDPEGVLTECMLSINENTRYAAFYHFRVDLSVIPNLPIDFPQSPGGIPNKLGFTIYATSGKSASTSVYKDLRELVANIRLVTPPPAASQ